MNMSIFRKKFPYLFLLLPFLVWPMLFFTPADSLEVYHFRQWHKEDVKGKVKIKESRFSMNKWELEKFPNVLITADRWSHFSGFNWLVAESAFARDYYLSFEKGDVSAKKNKTENAEPQAPSAETKKKRPPDFTISTGKDRNNGYLGVPFTLSGDKVTRQSTSKSKPKSEVKFQIDYHTVPWDLFWWALLCATLEFFLIVAARWITKLEWGRLFPLILVITLANYFLAFRLLFAHKALIHFPYSEKSFSLAKVALFAVPTALTIFFLVGNLKQIRLIGQKIAQGIKNKYYHQLIILGTASFVLIAFRFAVGLGQEALELGGRFALSLIFVPAFLFISSGILLFIYYWYLQFSTSNYLNITSLRGDAAISDTKHTLISALLIAAMIGIYILVGLKDKGLILLYLPPFIMVNAIFISTVKIRRKGNASWWKRVFTARRLLHLLNLGILFVFILLLMAPDKFFIMQHNVKENFRISASLDPREISDNFALQRVLSSMDSPLVLRDFSRATWMQMEELDRVKQYMELAGTDKGYTETVVDYSLGTRALHDYVTAVFLVPEFGDFWILITIGVLAVFAAVPVYRMRKQRREDRRRFSFLLFLMTGVTLFYTGLYMIGGNLFIFPFSGRNVYLWGLDSGSDIVEAVIMLAIFTLAYGFSKLPKTVR